MPCVGGPRCGCEEAANRRILVSVEDAQGPLGGPGVLRCPSLRQAPILVRTPTELGFMHRALPIIASGLILLATLAFLYALDRTPVHDGSARSRAEIRLLAAKLEAFALDTGDLPAELAELSSPVGPDPRPYARERELLDPWGRRYYYRILEEKRSALVFTLGRDGVPGGRGPDADQFAQARRDES